MRILKDKMKSPRFKKAISCAMATFMLVQLSAPAAQAAQKEIVAKMAEQDLKVAVLSDPHYYPEEYSLNTESEDYKNYMAKELYLLSESAAIFKSALEMVKKDNPDVLIIPGDMTKNSEKIGYEQVSKLLSDFEKDTGIDVFVTNGNHDIYHGGFRFDEDGNKIELSEDELTNTEEYYEFMKEFGYNGEFNAEYFEGSNSEEDDLSYVARPKEGFVIMSLNSQLYTYDENGNVTGQNGAGFSDELLNWAVEQIKKAEANGETVIAMAHHGLMPHSVASELSEGDAIVNNWEDTATKLADAGLRYIFTGHMHENDIAEYTTAKGNTLYDIETASTSAYGSPVRSVEFTKGLTIEDGNGQTTETVEVSSESVKTIQYKGETINNLQEYIYDSIYKDSEYLEIKLGGALSPIIEKIADLSLTDLIYGQSTVSEFNMDEKIGDNFGQALDGQSVKVEGKGTYNLDYDKATNEVKITSSKGIEEKINIDRFIKDLVKQIDDKVLDKDVLNSEIKNIISGIMGIEVYNADTPEKKVLRDVVNLFLIDHFVGAEDLSGWPQELIDSLQKGEGVKEIIDDLIISVLELLPNLLKKVDVNAKALTDDFILQIGINAMLGKDKSFYNLLKVLKVDLVDVVKKPISEYLDKYITPSFESQMGTLIGNLIYGLAGDDTQDDKIDGKSRVLTYTGSVAQNPSIENGLLPHSVAVTFGEDENTQKAFSWYTGKNVTSNEIQYVKVSDAKKDVNGNVIFDNATTVTATSEIVKRKFPTIDLGLIAISKDKEVTRHQLVLSNLEEGAEYYYRVGGETGYTDVATFEMAKAKEENFTFLHLSDTQSMLESEYDGWATVVDAAFDTFPNAKFLTHAGDMVDNGDNESQWQWFLNKPQDDLMDTTMVTTSGNHESMGDYSMVEHFNVQDMPSQDTTTGAYYKVDYGNTLLMVLNTENLVDNKLSDEQLNWLKETAAASDADWKIVQLHKAVYSNGSHYADDDVVTIREQLNSVLTELDIDLVLGGHDHVYARSEFLVNGQVEESLETKEIVKDGITYKTAVNPEGTMHVITGTSGVKFYQPVETDLPIAYSPNVDLPVFAGITIENDTLYYSAYTVNTSTGEKSLLDSYAITKEIVKEVNKEELSNLISESEKIDGTKYTQVSFNILLKALEEAILVLENEEATQEEVDFAISNIQSAIESLVEKEIEIVNKEGLESLVNKAEDLDSEKYTEESFSELLKALEEAKTILANENATKDEVDLSKTKLEIAIDSLIEKEATPVTKEELEALVNEVEKMDSEKYTEESFAKLLSVMEEVKVVIEKEDVTQEEIETAKVNLQNAIDLLVEKESIQVNKKELEDLASEVEKLDGQKYTEDSFAILSKTLEEAKAILAKEDITQEEIEVAKVNLQNAIDSLVEKESIQVNKKELENLVSEVEKLDAQKYTEDSFAILSKTLEEAKAILEKEDVTQEEINYVKSKLETAKDSLKEIVEDDNDGGNNNNTGSGNGTGGNNNNTGSGNGTGGNNNNTGSGNGTGETNNNTGSGNGTGGTNNNTGSGNGTEGNNNNTELPKTSDTSIIGSFVLGLTGLAGLFGIRRKNKK